MAIRSNTNVERKIRARQELDGDFWGLLSILSRPICYAASLDSADCIASVSRHIPPWHTALSSISCLDVLLLFSFAESG